MKSLTQTTCSKFLRAIGVVSFLVASSHVSAQEAGKVIMALGEVSIVREGKTIPAKRDTLVMAGDAITTGGTSNAQVKLNDGAIVALRPNTEFKVNEFKYNGKPDGTEKADLSLTKGGVRAVTGVIGRSNKENLKVNAAVATIGIRGTGFNIVFCDAACKQQTPQSNEGLYAGVFEGKISVSNQSGSTVDLGVNRFAYVANASTPPVSLIAPPTFLKDSLDGQIRVKTKDLNINGATDSNSNASANANAVAKAPSGSMDKPSSSPAEQILGVQVPTSFPDLIRSLGNAPQLFVARTGNLSFPPTNTPDTIKLRAAEWNPGTPTLRQLDLNLTINKPALVINPTTTAVTTVVSGANLYTVGTGTARVYEAGSDGGSIAWGRWAGGAVTLGAGYGNQTLEAYQGWHYILGVVPTAMPSGTFTFNLLAATQPTETRTGALAGWQLTGGTLTVSRGTTLDIKGLANLSLTNSTGWATFNMAWSNTALPLNTASELYGSSQNLVVNRTAGTINMCTSASGCAGDAYTGFYGVNGTHAGTSYQFNTGSYYVNGALIYKR